MPEPRATQGAVAGDSCDRMPLWNERPARGAEQGPRRSRGCDRRWAEDRFEYHRGSSLHRGSDPHRCAAGPLFRPSKRCSRSYHLSEEAAFDGRYGLPALSRHLCIPAHRPASRDDGQESECREVQGCARATTCTSLYIATTGAREPARAGIGTTHRHTVLCRSGISFIVSAH